MRIALDPLSRELVDGWIRMLADGATPIEAVRRLTDIAMPIAQKLLQSSKHLESTEVALAVGCLVIVLEGAGELEFIQPDNRKDADAQ